MMANRNRASVDRNGDYKGSVDTETLDAGRAARHSPSTKHVFGLVRKPAILRRLGTFVLQRKSDPIPIGRGYKPILKVVELDELVAIPYVAP